jgi:hypothetical protein
MLKKKTGKKSLKAYPTVLHLKLSKGTLAAKLEAVADTIMLLEQRVRRVELKAAITVADSKGSTTSSWWTPVQGWLHRAKV